MYEQALQSDPRGFAECVCHAKAIATQIGIDPHVLALGPEKWDALLESIGMPFMPAPGDDNVVYQGLVVRVDITSVGMCVF